MRTLNLKYRILAFMLVLFSTLDAQQNPQVLNQRTQESIDSFYNQVNSVNWREFDGANWLVDRYNLNCYPHFLQRSNLPPRIKAQRNRQAIELLLFVFLDKLQSEINKGRFRNIQDANAPLLSSPIRDRILNKLKDNLSQVDFIREVKGNGNLVVDANNNIDEPGELAKIWTLYDQLKRREYTVSRRRFGSIAMCAITEESLVLSFINIDVGNQKVTMKVTRYVDLNCECRRRTGSYWTDNGSASYATYIEGSYADRGLFNLIFNSWTKPFNQGLSLNCCPMPEGDSDGTPGGNDGDNGNDGNGGNGGNNGNDNGDSGDSNGDSNNGMTDEEVEEIEGDSGFYYDPNQQEGDQENCCYNEQANNSIGIFPIIQFGNNFNDTTIGIGLEYLHNMGTSFGNNNWFVGGAAMYANSSGADGELKENFYAGAAIVENRTPIVPCFQWVQRVCAQYGEGTLDAFGSEDEFNQFTFGIHTGINVDLSESVSIYGDATVLELGSQTYTRENGLETKTDIGNLGLGRQRIQFGIRFKFQ